MNPEARLFGGDRDLELRRNTFFRNLISIVQVKKRSNY
jgi:hypothetical protein